MLARALFHGGICHSMIVGNIVENSTRPPIEVTAGGHDLTIADNVLGGFEIDREHDPNQRTFRPDTAIVFREGVNARFVSITGNAFQWTRRSSIRFMAAASDVTISGNTFHKWSAVWSNEPSANDAGVRADAGAARNSITPSWSMGRAGSTEFSSRRTPLPNFHPLPKWRAR